MADAAAALPESDSKKKAAKKARKRKAATGAAPAAAPTGDGNAAAEAEAKKKARKKAAAKKKKKAQAEVAQAEAEAAEAAKKKKRKKKKKKPATPGVAGTKAGGCEATVHVGPVLGLDPGSSWRVPARRQPVVLYDPTPDQSGALVPYRQKGISRAVLITGGVAAAATVGVVLLLRSRKASASEPTEEVDSESGEDVSSDDTVHGDVDPNPGKKPLPVPVGMGKIPIKMTSVYKLFDRFIEGGAQFFANLADSESAHNFYAVNPKGVPLSKAGVERQMSDKNYGKTWSGSGAVPYTAYLEPEKAKQLGAMGLCQGIAGTIGQAGRRNGKAILAPLTVTMWDNPALQLAAFLELFGALYRSFGAKTPEQMRIAWGYPSKATKPSDPYYVDRAKKWAERQAKTGVSAKSFGSVTIDTYSVEETVAYFSQFDYSSVVNRNTPRMVFAQVGPIAAVTMARLQQQLNEHPAFIGNDLEP